jgi:hypothetical protein
VRRAATASEERGKKKEERGKRKEERGKKERYWELRAGCWGNGAKPLTQFSVLGT